MAPPGVRARARAAGQPISHYVLALARADDPARSALVVAAEERRALLEGMRNVDGTLRALRAPLPDCGGLTLLDAIALLARVRHR